MTTVTEMEHQGRFVRSCLQKTSGNREVRFDFTSAYGLHVSPRHGAPKEAQNYIKNILRLQEPLFPTEKRQITR